MMQIQNRLDRIPPEQAGISSKAVLAFVEQAEERGIPLHSFMLLRGGKVAAEGYYGPFKADHLHPIFSVSKSMTSAAIGIAIGEGLVKLTDRVAEFFPEKAEGEIHPYTARMTIEHLLLMATVHSKSTNTQVEDWVKSFLNTSPAKLPGTSFAYDTTGTHTLCAILQKVTGMTVLEYLRPRLFEPLLMGELWWESCPLGINKGGSGIRCTTEALARFGQLYLQDGVWNGVRILPEGWVERSTGNRIGTYGTRMMLDGKLGYGYQFWRIRNNGYCAFGMGGQLVIVLPDQELVFVTTANTLEYKDGQSRIIECFWSTIYAALMESGGMPLPADVEAAQALRERLAKLSLFLPEEKTNSPLAETVTGRKWVLDSNRYGYTACEFVLDGDRAGVFFHKDGEIMELPFGLGTWVQGTEPLTGQDTPSYGAAVWTDERTLVVIVHVIDPLQLFTFTCRFLEDGWVSIQLIPTGALLNDHETHLTGRLA
ncbi:serine hydrolase [Paenibacillus sp. GD4]|uniref:serine hydrolase domain-containing protein n=1 Tax=Paenibacillus sp. GD4 TaxID=3068890 RepID=UPI002796D12C|nr:serine hydrolase [Paenibacillus sp. GD4]MDQ1914556.1 serine hydrolase [Paenibacillus sp. GD4]